MISNSEGTTIIMATYKYGDREPSLLHPACDDITKNSDSSFHSLCASFNSLEEGKLMMMVDSEHAIFLTLSSRSSKATAGNLYFIDVVANLECSPRSMESSMSMLH